MGIFILIGIIFSAGLLGGASNYYLEKMNGAGFWKSCLLGLTAAATMPLFLKTVSSNLMEECLKGDPISHFVFFGFCTVAAIFSSKFLQSLGDRLLKDLQDVKEKQAELTDTTDVLVAQNSDPSPTDASTSESSDSSEFESFKQGSTRAIESAPSEMLRVQRALESSSFAFRTLAGIAQDTGIDAESVQSKLELLEKQGKAKQVKRARDGQIVWGMK